MQNFLYKNGFSLIVSAPEFVNVPGISEAEQVLLRSELSKAELLYWHQYYLYLYAAVIGFLGGLAGIIYMSRQEAKRRSEDQYIRGAQIISASDLDKRTRKEDGKFTAGKVHFPNGLRSFRQSPWGGRNKASQQ